MAVVARLWHLTHLNLRLDMRLGVGATPSNGATASTRGSTQQVWTTTMWRLTSGKERGVIGRAGRAGNGVSKRGTLQSFAQKHQWRLLPDCGAVDAQ